MTNRAKRSTWQYVLFTFGLICAAIPAAQAQVAEYFFEDNLVENVAGLDGAYFELGAPSANGPAFAAANTGMALLLDPTQGVALPDTLNSRFDTDTSLEITFDLVVTQVGDGGGVQWLVTLTEYATRNAPGISLFALHDPFSNNDDYEIRFNYADGGFDLGVPDHPGHEEIAIGTFNQGETVSVRLVVDFAARRWSALANDSFTSAVFDSFYDFQKIKSTVEMANAWVGWADTQEDNIAADPSNYTATVRYDNLRFYAPRQPGDLATLSSALAALTGHVDGSTPLSESQKESRLAEMLLNLDGNLAAALGQILGFTAAYEANYPPVFLDRMMRPFADLAPETRALVVLQQAIHDDLFVPTSIANMADVRFEAADVFPGTVDAAAPRTMNQTVSVDGTYRRIVAAPVVDDAAPAKRPTGYYAPPGELVMVTVPTNLTDQGLEVLVGAHDSDLSSRPAINRFVRISKTYPLDATTTTIGNPFGGGIYITVPEGSGLGSFDVVIDGAVQAPYYSTRSGRLTPISEWQADLAAQAVAWADMESDKHMMTLPLHHVATVADPSQLMSDLDAIMDAYNFVGGRPPARNRAAYFLLDSMLPGEAFGTGYPQVIGDEGAPYGPLQQTDYIPTIVLQPNFHLLEGYETTLHERGHGELHPTLVTEVETIVHVPASYIYSVLYGLGNDMGFQASSSERMTMDEATIDWMISINFRTNQSMGCDPTMDPIACDELRYQHRGHAKYVELADLFGWSAVSDMNKVFYDEWNTTPDPDYVITGDEMIEAAAMATGVNVAPLFHFWGLQPSPALAARLAMLPESQLIYDRLLEYRALAPQSAAQFMPWHTSNRPKKDPVHHARYDAALANYDTEGYGSAITAQIDRLIETYMLSGGLFGDGFETRDTQTR